MPDPLFPRSVRVGGELEHVGALHLLESCGRELEQAGARLLRQLARDLDGDAAQVAQRNALFSFSKKLSSGR
jgi:hypothetical protein